MGKIKFFVLQTASLIIGLLFCFAVQAADHSPTGDAGIMSMSYGKSEGKILLTVDGLITPAQAQLDLTMIQALPRSTVYTSTVVTDGVKRFDGVLMRDLLDPLGISGQAKHVEATALNDYLVDIPLADFYEYDVLLATHMDGVLLQPTDKGPLWIVYPRDKHRKLQDIRYDYRWVWQLKHLHIR